MERPLAPVGARARGVGQARVKAGELREQEGSVRLGVPVRALPGLGGDDDDGDLARRRARGSARHDAGRQPQPDGRFSASRPAAATRE